MTDERYDLPPIKRNGYARLVKQLYDHPLNNETTRQFRLTALDKSKQYAAEHGIEEEDIIAIPVGSFRNVPKTASDYDFVLFVNRAENPETLEQVFEPNLLEKLDIFTVMPFQYFDNPDLGLDSENRQSFARMAFNLLFTPDEYIYGNADQLAQLRLELISYIESGKVDLTNLWYDLNIELFRTFKAFEEQGIKSADKQKRFQDGVSQHRDELNRKYQGKLVGDKWEKAFLNSRKKLSLPTFEQVRDQLRSSSGKLSIR